MSKAITMNQPEISLFQNRQVVKEVGFISLAAILLSIGIIWFHNNVMFNEEIYEIYSELELAGITFMPYMISFAIACIAVHYLSHYIPTEKVKETSNQIAERIRQLGEGDLVTFARIHTENEEINDIARELSHTVAHWNSQMAQMKIINRQQWDLIQEVKQSSAKNDTQATSLHLKMIEENWVKIAEIEELIKT